MSCDTFKPLLMGYLDEELTELEAQRVERHLQKCGDCTRELQEFRKLKEVTHDMRVITPEDKHWDQYWASVYNRLERKVGWILVSIGSIILLAYAIYTLGETFIFGRNIPILIRVGVIALVGVLHSADLGASGKVVHLEVGQVRKDQAMIIVTTDQVSGRGVAQTLGVVKGNTVRARHLGKDVMAFLKNLVGGELAEYTEVIAQSREQALDRMVEEARSLGANAVVGLRFSTSYVTHGAAEIMAYGTAVILE